MDQNLNRPVLKLSKPRLQPVKPVETPKSFRQMRKQLQARWPDLFDKDHPVPLAIGIDREIVLRTGFKPNRVHRFLAYWTHRKRYRWSLEHSEYRLDLDGNIC
jgi:sRNA-binding protein